MTYNRQAFSELLTRAKLTNSDFARLIGVSRVTVYNWLTDGSPHSMIRKKFDKVVAAVQCAVDAGELPITVRRVTERKAAIVAAVSKHIRP
jgi:DNA-binding XRE family transcriptional regulator